MRILQEIFPQLIVQVPWSPKVMAPWEQMADLLPILQLRSKKQSLWKRNATGAARILHHVILEVGTGPQGSPGSLPTFTIPIHFPASQGPELAPFWQVDGSFLVACQNGNVQQPCHRHRGPTEGKLYVAAGDVQQGTGEPFSCRLPCCWNSTHKAHVINKIHIPIFHPNALLHGKGPTAVLTRVPTWAPAQWILDICTEPSEVPRVLQDAAFHTMHYQFRSGVDISELQAKVKQVHHAPLRWQQLTQFLLIWSLGVVKRWRKLK